MGIKEKLPLLNSEKKATRIAGYVVYAFVGLIVLGAIIPSPDGETGAGNPSTATTTETTTTATTVPAESGVLDEAAVKKLLPSGERNADVRVYNDGVVVITRKMKENLTPSMTLNGARIDSTDIFKRLFKDERVSKVTVISTAAFVDSYGQTSQKKGTEFTLTRSTAQKINWDSFLFGNLDNVADGYYIHPALK